MKPNGQKADPAAFTTSGGIKFLVDAVDVAMRSDASTKRVMTSYIDTGFKQRQDAALSAATIQPGLIDWLIFPRKEPEHE